MDTLFNKILEQIKRQAPCVVATVVSVEGSVPRKVGAKMVVDVGGAIFGTIGGGTLEKVVIADALYALRRKKSFLKEYPLDKRSGLQVCGGSVSIFLEVVEPEEKLIICGGGHIGLSLSLIAKLLGFHVTVIDNRRDFADKKRFAHADHVVCGAYRAALSKINGDKKTFIVIVTHAHAFDAECLAVALRTQAGYIGMIGSRAKIKHVFDALMKKGVKKSRLSCVHAPIGLAIGAETPEEIAVAIAAQLVEKSRKIKV